MSRYALGGDVWQIVQAGTQLQIGGSSQRAVTRTFRTPEQAAAAHDKLVAEKLAAGYLPAAGDPRSAELEAAIAANPDDGDAYAIYADWLEREGDPRGPLIAAQIAGERAERSGKRDKKIDAAAAKLFAEHADYFLGPLAELAADAARDADPTFVWRYGYLYKAYLHAERHQPIAARVAQLLAHPSARFLGELALGGRSQDANMQDAIGALAARAPASLRALRLWAAQKLELGALWPALPELRRLALAGQAIALGPIELPALEKLSIVDSELPHASARAIACAPWPRLRELELDFSTGYLTGDASIDDVFALLARRDLPALTRLALRHTRYIREVVIELAASPLAAQLEQLDLSNNQMTDEHARALAAAGARLPRLAALDVSANKLSPAGVAALAPLAPKLYAQRQTA